METLSHLLLWFYHIFLSTTRLQLHQRFLPDILREFEKCYGENPYGLSKRVETDSPEGRWRSFTLDEIMKHHYKLDSFKWMRDEELDDPEELPEPEESITEAMEEIQLALDNLIDIQRLLEGNGVAK